MNDSLIRPPVSPAVSTPDSTPDSTPAVPQVALDSLPGRPCPAAAALEVVGERWSLLVVRELAMGSGRFTDIVRGTGAPRDRVAARLRSLEASGVVRRTSDTAGDTAGARGGYALTPAGHDLLPVLDALLVWGRTHAVAPDDPRRRSDYPRLAAD
ncbi:winged helix-turn-helix transcriptional regulator [Nocardioides sp. Leaf374]|uniref:winged helix-turn-helix transcriptional regulator n=1 Tax=Nocardioides sp. Leaf374 TaxID=2876560 RepID=UPI001E2C4459|nr:helix-turn-helix domain-containing protein [Nocardioides sp. Leaf374]